jgi:protein SCO1/2
MVMQSRILPVFFAALTLAPLCRPQGKAAGSYFTDTILIDQNGVERKFYTDLVRGKTVVIHVMFTACKDSCPIMAGNFARIQESLGERIGKDVNLLSISIDADTDNPARLKEYADVHNARPGWFVLGGKKENVDFILKKLGLYVEQKQDHLNLFLIGNERTGLWKKALGVADAKKLIEIVNSVVHDGE